VKIDTSSNLLRSEFVKLKGDDWLKRLRIAGKCVSSVMTLLDLLVKEKTTNSLIELNDYAEKEILKQGCTPTFKNYKGFPAAVCMSVNKQLVHGIPADYKLQEGDLISFDFGATYEGAIADSAITCIYGNPKSKDHISLIAATNGALYAGIEAVKVGNRIGSIGNAVYKFSKSKGFNVIENYGGHGIDENSPHAPPFVPNRSNSNEGVRIQPGLTIAIEPMLVPHNSSIKTKTSSDGWTIYTEEIGAHFEHTIFVHEDKIEIITER
jgi:methionyl aminopeptidase